MVTEQKVNSEQSLRTAYCIRYNTMFPAAHFSSDNGSHVLTFLNACEIGPMPVTCVVM